MASVICGLVFFDSLHASTAAKITAIWLEVFTRRKNLPISLPTLILSTNLFSCVNDCIEDMATFTVLTKILSTNCSCNTEVHVAGLSKIFSHKIFCYMVFLLDGGLNKCTCKVVKESTLLLCSTVAVKKV